jgi:ribosomal protein L32
VSEYQSQFDELARGILLYNSGFDDTFFITKFLGGLKEEIRSTILLHRPKDVDTASALALIQEEELDSCRHKLSVKSTSAPNFRAHQVVEKQKGIETDKLKAKVVKGDTEDKLATLKLYRRKNRLCFKCGEKWGPGNKCHVQVSIHVLEELLDAVDEESGDPQDSNCEMSNCETVMDVGTDQTKQSSTRKTMRLCGKVANMEVMILVDSGSVGSIINNQLTEKLSDQVQSYSASQFMTVDGTPMLFDKHIPNLHWTTQGHTFVSSIGILPLKCYDMILGQD